MAGQSTEQSMGVLTGAQGTRPPALVRYGVAVGAVTLALLLTLAFSPFSAATPTPLFFLATIGGAWYGGVRAGLLATLYATAALDYFFIPPLYSLTPQVPHDLALLGTFVTTSLAVSLLTAARRQAEAALRHMNQTLEQRVQDRTVALAQANAALQAELAVRKSMEEALRTNAEQYRRMIETADEGIWTVNAEGYTTFVNPRMAEILGYNIREMWGRSLFDFVCEEDRPQMELRWQQWQKGSKTTATDVQLLRKEGTAVWTLAQAAPVFNEQGIFSGALSMFTDITTRKQAEEEIRQLNAELEQRVTQRTAQLQRSTEDLQQFARVATHDLQEPLRQVINYTQLLGDRYQGKLDAEADEFIGYTIEGAKRLQRLILDLLAYTEVETHPQALTTVDGEAVLAGALSDLRDFIAERGATVTHDLLPTVWGDALQLQTVFRNLLANGIKFRNIQPPHVHVAATPQGKEWIFSVRDNGIGITPQDQERIFMVFQRLHHQEPYPKPSIGLSICKKIIERHGGKIWVESAPGQGTTFLFTLPVPEASLPNHASRRNVL